MNGSTARALRKRSNSRKAYKALKRSLHADQGQNPKPVATRARKPKAPIKPTWPRTDDQRRQSRPMIVIHPVRQAIANAEAKGRERTMMYRESIGVPKHLIDLFVLRQR